MVQITALGVHTRLEGKQIQESQLENGGRQCRRLKAEDLEPKKSVVQGQHQHHLGACWKCRLFVFCKMGIIIDNLGFMVVGIL